MMHAGKDKRTLCAAYTAGELTRAQYLEIKALKAQYPNTTAERMAQLQSMQAGLVAEA